MSQQVNDEKKYRGRRPIEGSIAYLKRYGTYGTSNNVSESESESESDEHLSQIVLKKKPSINILADSTKPTSKKRKRTQLDIDPDINSNENVVNQNQANLSQVQGKCFKGNKKPLISIDAVSQNYVDSFIKNKLIENSLMQNKVNF